MSVYKKDERTSKGSDRGEGRRRRRKQKEEMSPNVRSAPPEVNAAKQDAVSRKVRSIFSFYNTKYRISVFHSNFYNTEFIENLRFKASKTGQ